MDVLLRVDAGSDADDADTAELAVRLRDELDAHDLDPVVTPAAAPPGTKGVGVVEVDGDRLELTGATDDERRRALAVWLARHEGGTGGGDTPD